MLRVLLLVAVVVVPGALVLLAAWALARLFARHLQASQEQGSRRWVHALARVRPADIAREIRRVV